LADHVKNTINLSQYFEKMRIFITYKEALRGYNMLSLIKRNNVEIHKSELEDIPIDALLAKFILSTKDNWNEKRAYYFATFEVINSKLEEKGVNLNFDML
jgi:hypothetical protein